MTLIAFVCTMSAALAFQLHLIVLAVSLTILAVGGTRRLRRVLARRRSRVVARQAQRLSD